MMRSAAPRGRPWFTPKDHPNLLGREPGDGLSVRVAGKGGERAPFR